MFYNKDLVIEFSEESCLIRVISLCLHETCVCASNWLTVSVGVWRFLAISFPFKAVTYCSKYRSKVVVSVIILLSIVLWTLYYISFECYLMIYDLTDDSGEVHEVVVRFTHNRRKTKEPSYSRVHHPIRILTTTAVPCTILIVVSVALIVRLWMARRARGAMTNERVTSVSQETEENNVIERRVTLVLTAMIMMNFFTYLPVNVIYVFYQETNLPIIISRLSWSRYLVLICNCLTICFYCFMSTKLRQTYARFLSLPFSRWNPVKVKSHSSTSIRSTVSETSIL